MFRLSGVLNQLAILKLITNRGLGPEPQPLDGFCDFSEKNSQFNAICITFRTFLEPIERTKLLKFESHLKKLNSSAPLPLTYRSRPQRWSREHKAQGQGHQKNPRPRPRTAFPRTQPLEAKDSNARGQGQEPRTQAQAFSKKKRSSKIFFKRSPIHWRTQNFWLGEA